MNKKLTIILITVVILIMTEIAVVYSISVIREKLVDNLFSQYEEQEISLGEQVSKNIVNQISQLRTDLEYFSQIQSIRTPNLSTCNADLESLLKIANGSINNLGRVGKDKKFLCSVNKALVGTDASKLGTYIDEIFDDANHAPVLSHIIKIPNVDGYAVALHVPIYNTNGEFEGTVGGAIYFNQIRDNLLKDVTFVKGGFVALMDDNLDVLYHPKTEYISSNILSPAIQAGSGNDPILVQKIKDAANGIKGTYRYKFNSEERVGAFVPATILENRRWIVNVVIPLSSATQQITDIGVDTTFVAIYGMLTIGIILAPLIILLYLLQTVFKPIDRMTGSLKLISEGHLDTLIPDVTNNKRDEINLLALSFNNMAKQLNESYSILESKVKQRTEALEKEKDSLEEKVVERTKELEAAKVGLEETVKSRTQELALKIKDLEELNRVMVDRELRMSDLKREIEALKTGKKEGTIDRFSKLQSEGK